MRPNDTERDAAETLPLAEERLTVGRETVESGIVRVNTPVETLHEIVEATLREERVEITRVPVDAVVERAPPVRTEGEVTIVPVLEEVLVVEKRLVLREELHIRRRTEERAVEIPVERRRQHAVVEREDATETPPEKG